MKEVYNAENILAKAINSRVLPRNNFICSWCKHRADGYVLKDDVWAEIGPTNITLCLWCAEIQLGRQLRADDFIPCQLNIPVLFGILIGRREGRVP